MEYYIVIYYVFTLGNSILIFLLLVSFSLLREGLVVEANRTYITPH